MTESARCCDSTMLRSAAPVESVKPAISNLPPARAGLDRAWANTWAFDWAWSVSSDEPVLKVIRRSRLGWGLGAAGRVGRDTGCGRALGAAPLEPPDGLARVGRL